MPPEKIPRAKFSGPTFDTSAIDGNFARRAGFFRNRAGELVHRQIASHIAKIQN